MEEDEIMELDVENLIKIMESGKKEVQKNDDKEAAILYITDTKNLMNLVKAYKKVKEENKELKNKLREKICFDGHRQFEELKEENKALKNILGQYKLLTYSRFGKTFRVGDNVDDYIPKQTIKELIDKLKNYRDLAKEQINEKIVIADSDSLNYGRAEAHSKDIEELQKLLQLNNNEVK